MIKPEMKNRILHTMKRLLAYTQLRSLGLAVALGVAVSLLAGCATPQQKPAATAGTQIRTITLAELERSLPPPPVHVAFDVDDTTLFTSAGFQWGTRMYGKEIVSAGVSVREEELPTLEAKQKYREFWTKMNNDLDQYSVKKWIASELIRMHKARGDQIYFVTKRINTGSEKLTALLRNEFELPNLEPVIFTNRGSKTPAFRRVQAVVSYGDSDGDIRESIEAGARPVRVLRARTSVNVEPVHNGAFGEEVLLNSEF
jgi:acid phosphatase (class B)